MRDVWKRTRYFLYKRVLHADDSPHRIALGAGVAMLVAFSPTFGFQTVIAIALAALLRANKAVCIPVVWITNPVTAPPIYLGCWKLGRALAMLPDAENAGNVSLTLPGHHHGIWSPLFEAEFWRRLPEAMFDFGLDLWLGCLLVGAAAGIITYFATRWGVTEYRQRRRVQMIYRNIRRARMRKSRHRRRNGVGRVAASPEGT